MRLSTFFTAALIVLIGAPLTLLGAVALILFHSLVGLIPLIGGLAVLYSVKPFIETEKRWDRM